MGFTPPTRLARLRSCQILLVIVSSILEVLRWTIKTKCLIIIAK
jgi:hypothetical protein